MWNFSSGPSMLPYDVIHQMSFDILDWNSTGVSVFDISHRSKYFEIIYNEAESDLRELLGLSSDYCILFMQGGGQGANAIIPMNIIGRNGINMADFIVSGYWSSKSYIEACKYGDASIVASSNYAMKIDYQDCNPYTWFPKIESIKTRACSSYLQFCSNETINGVEFVDWNGLVNSIDGNAVLVADVSSNFLTRELDINCTGVVFSCAQKNAGISGVTIFIVRKDLIGMSLNICPSVFDYKNVVNSESRYNTPPVFAIYVSGLVFKWLKSNGGIKRMESNNLEKSRMFYDFIDSTSFYTNTIHSSVRSRVNIPFFLKNDFLTDIFVEKAESSGIINIKGHRSMGGLRASMYNAMPIDGINALINYMRDFERYYG
ncbi:phosphoserine aminotransferase [Candidatus Kinetoplastibacterium blastocrithidii TCC012E]|uniref:Phosphoserine aminotransferase n=1 Tax=Candidatus Kinetoplastidibacterium blastocrithidiae TCC012E TaxID=1208922 RepID=M1LBN5_9PROT|nr:phosphoserine aminotransferase [Candidatus Kinetoplastibacterium blastocrithidii (ex Strigomonas culicis)]AGF49858.1 phosphoserine aminotransferase [Candidatus Kinetoplastibacterium blastocrithidii TCC012E]